VIEAIGTFPLELLNTTAFIPFHILKLFKQNIEVIFLN